MDAAALLNGTLYYYGGRTKTQGGQTENQWSEYHDLSHVIRRTKDR